MSSVAILGAGPIGASTAHRLAQRARVRDIRLVDAKLDAARGEALDLLQCGPIEGFDTRVQVATDPLSVTGADVIVIADRLDEGEWTGEAGGTLLAQLARSGTSAALVFAGPSQQALMDTAAHELRFQPHRLIGTASTAVVGAVQALAALELQLSCVELTVVGRAPGFVIGWSAATAAGSLLTDCIPPHRLLAISSMLPKLWPPGPHALGSATARVVEALIEGARRLLTASTIVEGPFAPRATVMALPLELGRNRVLSHVIPSLSAQERTDVMNMLAT